MNPHRLLYLARYRPQNLNYHISKAMRLATAAIYFLKFAIHCTIYAGICSFHDDGIQYIAPLLYSVPSSSSPSQLPLFFAFTHHIIIFSPSNAENGNFAKLKYYPEQFQVCVCVLCIFVCVCQKKCTTWENKKNAYTFGVCVCMCVVCVWSSERLSQRCPKAGDHF